MKKFISYILLFVFLPFVPIIYIIILFYKYIIIYLWLFLDIIFKDFLSLKDYSIYDKIQKFFKYVFYEFFFEVLPLIIFKYFKLNYLFYLFVQLIIKIQNLFLRLIFFFISSLPILFKILKYTFLILRNYIKNILKKMNIYLYFNKNVLKKIIYYIYYIFFDFIFLFKFVWFYLYLNLLYKFKYSCFFDKIYLVIINILYFNKYLFVVNLINKNNNFYLNLFRFINNFKINYKSKIKIFFYDYLFIFFFIFSKLMLVEIKNILLFNKYFRSNKIKLKFLKFFKKLLWLYEYIMTYWLLNKLLIKRNYRIYWLFKNSIIFNNYFKLIKYYIKKFRK